MPAIAQVIDLVKNYYLESVVVPALRGVTLTFEEGDFVALMGPSGSGKSTLLNLLGCLDRPTSGQYYLGEEDVSELDDDQLSEARSRYLGFIFQSYNLLAQYTVVENIEIPLLYQGTRLTEETRHRCYELAELVGLGDRLDHRPMQLSGGQQQRDALAREIGGRKMSPIRIVEDRVVLIAADDGGGKQHIGFAIVLRLQESDHCELAEIIFGLTNQRRNHAAVDRSERLGQDHHYGHA